MKIRVTKDEIKIEENSKIHKGEYNATKLEFIFSEEYGGLTKKAIFEADKDKLEVSIVNDECYIPATILSGKANKFNLRVYATENNGSTVIKRYSPSYISIPLHNGSYIGNTTPIPSANLQNKSVTITENGIQTVTADTGYDGLESVEIETNVPSSGGNIGPTVEVSYTGNGNYTIEPSSGYDGIEGANVIVDVPSEVNNETQYHTITENGSYVYTPTSAEYTGMDSVSVDVNVPSSGSGIDLTSGIKFGNSNFSTIPNEILNANWEDISEMDNMFSGNGPLQTVPTLGTTSITSMQYTFSNCSGLVTVNSMNTQNVLYMSGMFSNCSMLEDIPQFDTSSCLMMDGIVTNCPNLTNTSLNNLLAMCTNVNASYIRPKALKDLGLDDTQIATCRTLSNYQDALNAGWTDYVELTVDVSLNDIYAESGQGNYIVPQLNAFDGYIYVMGVQLTLNDPTLQTQVTGVLNSTHFDSNDYTLSFDINYTGLAEGNQYYFENIVYNPQV